MTREGSVWSEAESTRLLLCIIEVQRANKGSCVWGIIATMMGKGYTTESCRSKYLRMVSMHGRPTEPKLKSRSAALAEAVGVSEVEDEGVIEGNARMTPTQHHFHPTPPPTHIPPPDQFALEQQAFHRLQQDIIQQRSLTRPPPQLRPNLPNSPVQQPPRPQGAPIYHSPPPPPLSSPQSRAPLDFDLLNMPAPALQQQDWLQPALLHTQPPPTRRAHTLYTNHAETSAQHASPPQGTPLFSLPPHHPAVPASHPGPRSGPYRQNAPMPVPQQHGLAQPAPLQSQRAPSTRAPQSGRYLPKSQAPSRQQPPPLPPQAAAPIQKPAPPPMLNPTLDPALQFNADFPKLGIPPQIQPLQGAPQQQRPLQRQLTPLTPTPRSGSYPWKPHGPIFRQAPSIPPTAPTQQVVPRQAPASSSDLAPQFGSDLPKLRELQQIPQEALVQQPFPPPSTPAPTPISTPTPTPAPVSAPAVTKPPPRPARKGPPDWMKANQSNNSRVPLSVHGDFSGRKPSGKFFSGDYTSTNAAPAPAQPKKKSRKRKSEEGEAVQRKSPKGKKKSSPRSATTASVTTTTSANQASIGLTSDDEAQRPTQSQLQQGANRSDMLGEVCRVLDGHNKDFTTEGEPAPVENNDEIEDDGFGADFDAAFNEVFDQGLNDQEDRTAEPVENQERIRNDGSLDKELEAQTTDRQEGDDVEKEIKKENIEEDDLFGADFDAAFEEEFENVRKEQEEEPAKAVEAKKKAGWEPSRTAYQKISSWPDKLDEGDSDDEFFKDLDTDEEAKQGAERSPGEWVLEIVDPLASTRRLFGRSYG